MKPNTYLLATDGLCNRMRTIDSAIALTSILDRNLKVIWVKNELLNSSFSSLFESINGIELIESSNKLKYAPSVKFNPYPKNNPERKNGLNKILSTALWKYQCTRLNIKGSVFYDDLLMIANQQAADSGNDAENNAYDLIYKKIHQSVNTNFSNYIASCWRLYPDLEFYSRFTPISSIQERIGEHSKTFSETFGLHIRRTDHKEAIAMSGLDKFITIIDNQISNNQSSTFFLATDDSETESHLKKVFGEKIITSKKTSFSRNTEQGIQDAVVDLYCLSRTKKIFGSFKSSFSQVAADISGIEVQTVC